MPRKLKVFRTPIGFHDAYVAAASQKDALSAWGSDANLFARGLAEIVTDPSLIKEPLANPGAVVKRARGSTQEHFDALPQKPRSPARSTIKKRAADKDGRAARKTVRSKPALPRPSRARLDRAEQALADLQKTRGAKIEKLRKREEALRVERRELETRLNADAKRLEDQINDERSVWDKALTEWRRQS